MTTSRWKSCPIKAGAGRSEPSLAGVAVTQGPKRRQGSCGVRVASPEISDVAEAQSIANAESNRIAVDRPDSVLPSGSWTASRTKGRHWNLGGPAGAAERKLGGGWKRGKTGATVRAEAGSLTGS